MTAIAHVSEEAEDRLISACIAGGPSDVYAATARGITSEVFAVPEHRTIWNALIKIASEQDTTDIVALTRELEGFATDYGLDRLARFDGLEPTSARREQLVLDVLSLWRWRNLDVALRSASEAANAAHQSWNSVLEAVEPHLRAARQWAQDLPPRSLSDDVREARASLCGREPPGAIQSPFGGWDREAGRICPGELVVLGGRPGWGKTALALQFADRVAASGLGVLFASLEMTGPQIVARLAQQRARSDGVIEPGAPERYVEAAVAARERALQSISQLEGSLRILEAKEGGNFTQLEAQARLMASGPRGLALIVIDYLQLLTPPPETRRENRERQVAEMSRRAKLLAVEVGCPVLLLTQLNREPEKEQRRPRLSDLRESGAIEQDADRVWLLFSLNAAAAESDKPLIEVSLLQAKCRNGQAGVLMPLQFKRDEARLIA